MGFQGYSDDELERVVANWRHTDPAPGSVGEKAKRDALDAWQRRREDRDQSPGGGDTAGGPPRTSGQR